MQLILKSVQFYNYSDIIYEIFTTQRQIKYRFAPKKSTLDQELSATQWHSSRLVNRAVSEMRKAQLQVCQGTGSWPQALFIHKSSQKSTRDVLRSQRQLQAGSEVIGRIFSSPRKIRRNQCDQCRINPAARGGLNGPIDVCCRCRSYGYTTSQRAGSSIKMRFISGGYQP